ncbi:AraC family transcriptional regulator ligand-binding domain-containing protein [Mesorhizobium sp. LHD-90]|uniref:AraC-like transcriptional regulator QhpR n=1 Tax=Mesorhizobium sp. LHD-90 TaxID=3071414 RepID=UPI0027E06765|nr:AraC family transcriptional regulator ligand-binding domain-containing protein [Mesorhizobium sp. LHD-90]MDQ6434417.1 AraC family transcriptional regulator ligand-binding domain-containing protein [Mesorhizobium sp. LHD-90]
MHASGTIAPQATTLLLDAIASKGQEPDSILARLGLTRASLAGHDTPLAIFTGILEAAARERGDTTFGLKLGRAYELRSLGSIATVAFTAPTLGWALAKFTGYFSSLQSKTETRLDVSGDLARLCYSISDPTVRSRNQDADFTMAVVHRMVTTILGAGRSIDHIDFEHDCSDDLDTYRAHFRCSVQPRRARNAIYFPVAYLEHRVDGADPVANARAEQELQDAQSAMRRELDLSTAIQAWMSAALARGLDTDIDHAAADFGVSLRTFQRRLAESGFNFVDIRNTVRVQIAKCMLASTAIPLTAIALQLGYSEASAFSRSFKVHAGETPGDYRASARGA